MICILVEVGVQQARPGHNLAIRAKKGCGRQGAVLSIGVHEDTQCLLANVVDASRLPPFLMRPDQGRQQKGSEHPDDGNDDEKLDQGKSLSAHL